MLMSILVALAIVGGLYGVAVLGSLRQSANAPMSEDTGCDRRREGLGPVERLR